MFRRNRTQLPFPATPEVDPLAAHRAIHQKVKLAGSVAGVESCELVTGGTEIIVGSAITCDLVVLDPLAPRRAFRLVHTKEHAAPHLPCDTCWVVEPYPGARVYLNRALAEKREEVRLGDTLALGCHQLRFSAAGGDARDRKANVRVDDLCRELIRTGAVPPGYLNGRPNRRDRARTRRAWKYGAVIASLLLVCFFLFRRPEDLFEAIQPPIEVTLGDHVAVPAGESMTALSEVERKTFDAPGSPAPSDLAPAEAPALADMTAEAIVKSTPTASEPPSPPELRRTVTDAGPVLQTVANIEINDTPVRLKQARQKLGQSAPIPRRYTRDEAARLTEAAELGVVRASVTRAGMASAASTKYADQLSRQPRQKPRMNLDAQRADVLAALQPSKTELTDYKGQKIPVARIPTKLETLAITGAELKRGIEIDGNVSQEEMAMSFKTGRFRVHGPGNPPEADPATYCYVSKTRVAGKDNLYISFVCMDPNLSQLVTNWATGTAKLAMDDSVEVFVDIDGNRVDYHQIIVNAKGEYFAQACPNGDRGINGEGLPWNVKPTIKTTINRDAGRWVCEILIPYDAFPSVPAKGTKVPVNFCRNFRGQGADQATHLQNWFSVYEGGSTNYHHPRLFGVLEWP
jgi:hypothetical protein